MIKKQNKNILLLILIFAVSVGLYYWFYKSPYFAVFFEWSKKNIVLFISAIFLIKVAGIVYPPISGGIFTLGSIPFLGWPISYLIDLSGSIIGGAIAYFLGQKYGYDFLHKLFDQDIVEKIKKMRVKKGKEIEAIFVYRILLGGTILEAVCYGAGVLKVNFMSFMIGSVLSHVVVGIPTYFLANNILTGGSIVLAIFSTILIFFLFTKLKNRYFE